MKPWQLGASALALLFAASPALAVPSPMNGFTPNVHLISTYAGQPLGMPQDVEPEIRTDTYYNSFISAIRGVPAGNDLWEIPKQQFYATQYPTYIYRGQPDGLPLFTPTTGLAPGGGDTDVSIGSFATTVTTTNSTCTVGMVAGSCPPGPLTITSLSLAEVNSVNTADQGVTYNQGTNAATPFFGDDREWNNSNGGLERYDVTHDLYTSNIDFDRSLDAGITWQPGTPTNTGDPVTLASSVQNNELGPIVVDQNHVGQPGVILYEIFVSVATPQENVMGNVNAVPFHTVYVAKSLDDGMTWTDTVVYNGPITKSYDHIFPSMAVDALGHVYAVFSDDTNVFLVYSTDHGTTWRGQGGLQTSIKITGTPPVDTPSANPPINVTANDGYVTHIFPWIHAGYNGGVDVVYYKTMAANTTVVSDYQVGMAQNVDVTGTNGLGTRNFVYYTPTDHSNHHGVVCEGGVSCTGTGNRNLADDFQIYLDPVGKANITYTDDHDTTITPQVYFTHQVYGSNLGTPNGDGQNLGCQLIGTTVTGGTVAAGTPMQIRVKAPAGVSRGWMTLILGKAVAAGGYITSYHPISLTAANFSGMTPAKLPFSGSIANGSLSLKVGTGLVRATLTKGTVVLK